MRIAVTGSRGMLGRDVVRCLGMHHKVIAWSRQDFDIASPEQAFLAVNGCRPDVVVHCAAYTAVDDCESNKDRAYVNNALGCANLAMACQRNGVRLIAISTDYVFNGLKCDAYCEWDVPDPRTVYGMSKLAGERAIQSLCANHLIIRVAWLYGNVGPSFVHTMLRLGRESAGPLKVVNDQVGNPTSTFAVAQCIKELIDSPLAGIVHSTCSGEASWYEFSKEIFRIAKLTRQLEPCSSEMYPRLAPRPKNSRLNNLVLGSSGFSEMPEWKVSLEQFLGGIL